MLSHCFARLSLRRLGNNKQCVGAAHTAKTKRDNFQIHLKSSLFCFWLFEQHLVCYCSRSPCDPVGMGGFCVRRAQRALFQTHSTLTDAVFYTEFFNEHKSYYSVIAALANSPNRSMRSEFCLLNSRCSKSFFLIERSVVFNTSSIATLRSCAEPMPLRSCKKL